MSLRRSTALREALAEWANEGLVSSVTVEVLTSRYELDGETIWYRNTSFMIGLVASALVTAGLILFISENWHNLGIPARMLTGIIPWLAAALLTIRATNHSPRTGEAWGFLTSLLFGVNIFLQAQIFHLGGYWPTALMWWSAGTLVLGYVLSSNANIALAQVLGVAWIASLTTLDNYSPLVLVGTAIIATATVGKLSRMTTTGLIALICFALAHVSNALDLPGRDWLILWSVLGLLAIALYQWAEPVAKRFRDVMSLILGYWIVLMVLMVTGGQRATTILVSNGNWFTTLLYVIAAATMLVARRDVWSIGGALLVGWLVLGSTLPADPWLPVTTIGLNVILFGVAVLLMWSGIKHSRKIDFMTALVLIIAHAFARFTDYFDDYLIGAVVFMGAGVILFIANMLWNRRYATH